MAILRLVKSDDLFLFGINAEVPGFWKFWGNHNTIKYRVKTSENLGIFYSKSAITVIILIRPGDFCTFSLGNYVYTG